MEEINRLNHRVRYKFGEVSPRHKKQKTYISFREILKTAQTNIGVLQENPHRAKASSDLLSWRFSYANIHVALVQEPIYHIYVEVKGINIKTGILIHNRSEQRPRTSILV